MNAPLLHHRSDEFRHVTARVLDGLRYVFQTSSVVVPLSCSGSGSMEAVVTNLCSPGETILSVNAGKFGARWGELARAFGLKVEELVVPWGESVSAGQIKSSLNAHPDIRAVFLTHSETSTGTAIHLREIASVIRQESDALVCVDGITSVAAHELYFDDWGIDACVTSSQKGLMSPPGLSFVALSPRAIEALNSSTMPRFYFDLRRAIRSAATNDTPWTPPITLMVAVDEALAMIRAEGIELVWKRHERHTGAVRSAMSAMGLRLFSDHPSHALTAVWLPEGISWRDFQKRLREDFGVFLAGGQGDFAGRIFRFSHLGYCDDFDIVAGISSVEMTLVRLGAGIPAGEGTRTAQRRLL
jgi:aspartate aminotransferase-like enzyme